MGNVHKIFTTMLFYSLLFVPSRERTFRSLHTIFKNIYKLHQKISIQTWPLCCSVFVAFVTFRAFTFRKFISHAKFLSQRFFFCSFAFDLSIFFFFLLTLIDLNIFSLAHFIIYSQIAIVIVYKSSFISAIFIS